MSEKDKEYIAIKKLEKYQHYKNRDSMPWIKWHRKCLRDNDFVKLSNEERWIFIGLVLLATENGNKVEKNLPLISQFISNPQENTKYFRKKLEKILKKFTSLNLILLGTEEEIDSFNIKKHYNNRTPDKRRVDKRRKERADAREGFKPFLKAKDYLERMYPFRGDNKS